MDTRFIEFRCQNCHGECWQSNGNLTKKCPRCGAEALRETGKVNVMRDEVVGGRKDV